MIAGQYEARMLDKQDHESWESQTVGASKPDHKCWAGPRHVVEFIVSPQFRDGCPEYVSDASMPLWVLLTLDSC